MEQNLMDAAQAGNIDAMYESIRQDPNILERIDGTRYVNTPLHAAASAGHTHFAIEIISLMPSFGRKLNPDGLSPLLLALQNGHSETVKRLVKFDSELVRVQGRERLTPLHCVAKTGDIDLLAAFLCACPASIKDLTVREETALHVAVRSSRVEAVNVLLEWLRRTFNRKVVNWRDERGNTALHIAVSTLQPQIVKLLVKRAYMLNNVKNLQGLTALDIALGLGGDEAVKTADTEEIRDILRLAKAARASSVPNDSSVADYLSSKEPILEFNYRNVLYWRRDLTLEMRNVVLVVAVLIATATFEAVLSPPAGGGGSGGGGGGGGDIDNSIPHLEVFSKPPAATENVFLHIFYVLNTVAFIASIMVMIVVLQLRPYSWLLHLSLVFLGLSYGFSLFSLLTWPLAACLMIFVFILSGLCYCSKFFFSVMEDQATAAFRVRLLLPESLSRHLKRRLELIHRVVY